MKYKVKILDKEFTIKAPNSREAKEMAIRAYTPRTPSLQSLRKIAKVKKILA